MNRYVLLGLTTFSLVLITAYPASADNCGSLSDCYYVARAAVIAAAALSTLAAVLLGLSAITYEREPQRQESIPWWQSPFKHTVGFVVGLFDSLKETVKGLFDLGVYASEWLIDPGNNAQRLSDLKDGVAQLTTREGLQAVWDGLKRPIEEAWERGAYGEAMGRVAGLAGQFLIGPKGMQGLVKGGTAAVGKEAPYLSRLHRDLINDLKLERPELKHIPTDELAAVRGYTSADYERINNALRNQDVDELAQLDDYIKKASAGLQKLPDYKGLVTSGLDLTPEQASIYRPGNIVNHNGFTSSASNPQRSYLGNTKFVIESSSGKDISFLSGNPWETEILFPPNTKFEVISSQQNPYGVQEIYMKEVK